MSLLLECKNLSVGYSDKILLKDINLKFYEKDFIGLLGPNGSGKSTLVKSLLGSIPKLSGEIIYKDNIAVSYIPQKLKMNSQVPLSVLEFLELKPCRFDKDWLNELIEVVGLVDKKEESVHKLSGGYLQRLFVAYALLSKPKLLILDEATEGMDMQAMQEIFEYLKKYIEEQEACLIYISHDVSAVNEACSRVLCLHNGIGYDGSPNSPDFHQCLHKIYGEKSVIHDHRH